MNSRLLTVTLLAGLTVAVAAGCNDQPTAAAPSGNAVASSSASAAGTAQGDSYCTVAADLAKSTRQITSKPAIDPKDYTATAAGYDKLKTYAPQDIQPDIDTVATDYRAIGAGKTTMDQVASEVGTASLRIAEVTMTQCGPQ